jgi:hypothetical protein
MRAYRFRIYPSEKQEEQMIADDPNSSKRS